MAAVNAIARAERIKTMFGARMQGASHGDRVNHAHHVDNITAAAHQFMIEETKIELSIMCDERAIAQEIQQCLDKIGRAHVCTQVTNAHIVCRLLLEKQKT